MKRYYRTYSTANEKRAAQDWEPRGKRNFNNLPDSWNDEKHIHREKGWKHKTKRKAQHKPNQNKKFAVEIWVKDIHVYLVMDALRDYCEERGIKYKFQVGEELFDSQTYWKAALLSIKLNASEFTFIYFHPKDIGLSFILDKVEI